MQDRLVEPCETTLESTAQIWKYMRQRIRHTRLSLGHIITEPRLQSLDVSISYQSQILHKNDNEKVAAGSFRPATTRDSHNKSIWEAREQQKFRADLSERDDEARRDIATIRCSELEALKEKLGLEVDININQETLLKDIADRAENGPQLHRGERASQILLGQDLMQPPRFWEMHDKRRFHYR